MTKKEMSSHVYYVYACDYWTRSCMPCRCLVGQCRSEFRLTVNILWFEMFEKWWHFVVFGLHSSVSGILLLYQFWIQLILFKYIHDIALSIWVRLYLLSHVFALELLHTILTRVIGSQFAVLFIYIFA